MRVFAQYLKLGDVVANATLQGVVYQIDYDDALTGGQGDVMHVWIRSTELTFNEEGAGNHASVHTVVRPHQAVDVISEIDEDRLANMKMPPPVGEN